MKIFRLAWLSACAAFIGEIVAWSRFFIAWFNTFLWSFVALCSLPILGQRRMWTIFAPLWAKTTLWWLGVKVELLGFDEPLAEPVVFLCNHRSLLDVVVLPAILPPKICFVAKRELLWVPFWGLAFALGGAAFVARGNTEQAKKDLQHLGTHLPADWSVMVFPEGKRSRDGRLLPLKKGAFHLALQIQRPLVVLGIDGTQRCAPVGQWFVRGGHVRVVKGASYPTLGMSSKQLNEVASWAEKHLKQTVAQAEQVHSICSE